MRDREEKYQKIWSDPCCVDELCLSEEEQNLVGAAHWMLENKASVRDVEHEFGIPKTTFWWRIYHILPKISAELGEKCQKLLKKHRKNRKDRG